MEVHQLRGGEAGPSTSSPDSNFRRFAQDLRVTANTAEHSLRQVIILTNFSLSNQEYLLLQAVIIRR